MCSKGQQKNSANMKKAVQISYDIFPENQLITEHFEGLIDMPNFVKMKERQWVNSQFSKYYSIIADFRLAKFDHSVELHKMIADYVQNNKEKFGPIRLVIITSNANQMIMPILFKDELGHSVSIDLKTCSTVQAALIWCGVSLDAEKVIQSFESKIDRMESTGS